VTELIGLPIADFEWIRRLRLNSIRTRILVFTTSAEEAHVASALTEGASAYILKRSDSGILVRAINAAVGGDLVIDAAVKEAILRRLSAIPVPDRSELLKELTWREAGILALLAEGCSDREIAFESACLQKPFEIMLVKSLLRSASTLAHKPRSTRFAMASHCRFRIAGPGTTQCAEAAPYSVRWQDSLNRCLE